MEADTKAITLTQPWATLVAIGAKKLETRSWPTSYRGEIAIHAGRSIPKELHPRDWPADFRDRLERTLGSREAILNIPYGAIVAVANLTDVLPTRDLAAELRRPANADERAFGDFTPGRWAWVLSNVRMFVPPIEEVRGYQRIWTITGPVEREIYARLGPL